MTTTPVLDQIEARCADPQATPDPDATRRVAALRPTSIQLSRWRVQDHQQRRARGVLPPMREVFQVELRGAGGQSRAFAVTLPPDALSARLEGLPWLHVTGAEQVPSLDAMIDLVCAARRADAELARWDPAAVGSPPKPQRDRVLPRSLVVGLTLGQIGPLIALGIAGVTLFVAIILGVFVDLRDLTLTPDTRTEARIVDISSTHTSINNAPLMRYHIVYTDTDGNERQTTTTDWGRIEQTGDTLPIEYDRTHPDDVRVQGRGFGALPWVAAAIPTIIALLALLVAIGLMLRGSRKVRLLRRGHITLGTLADKRPTNVRINGRRVVELRFDFTVDGQQHTATGRTTSPGHFELGGHERIFFDRNNPTDAMLVDDVKTRIDIDDEGHIVSSGGLGTPLAIINGLLLLGCLGEITVLALVLTLG